MEWFVKLISSPGPCEHGNEPWS